ncbi:MAG: InlB B-repeat-containing protein [Clostridia bacterium]|nr:InlB B-repeat-containing protein [Clostridia bacterium]
MKKRIVAFILLLSMLLAIASSLGLNATAASTLTITSPSNDDHVSKSDPPKLKWSKVTGAAGYRVTVVNVDSGKDLVRNTWTTSTSYSLESLFDDTIGTSEYPLLKIWVGAMASKNDDPGLTSLSSDIIYIKACEAPDINVPAASVITANGANFYVTVEKNYGSAIVDAGVYIGTSTNIDNAKRYSAKRYSEDGILSKGTMRIKISTLDPDTKYYFWGYAENGVDETLSSRKSFTTKEAPGSLSVSTSSINWDDGADNSKTVTVNYTGSYSYNVEYDVGSDVINSGYNYEWLDVTQSGSSLILKPNRANYSGKDRTAYVTVTSNGKSKEIIVTQAKCSESAPTLQLWRGTQSNILNDGASFGNFDLPQNVIEVDFISKNIRKIYAQLMSPTGQVLAVSTNLNKISFDTGSLTDGEYCIKLFASNSATSNDYWSQRPFESLKVYFGLGNPKNAPNIDKLIIDEHKDYVKKSISYHLQNSEKVKAAIKSELGAVFIFDGVSNHFNNAEVVKNGYTISGKTYNRSAVCILVKAVGGKYEIVYACVASTTADQVRGYFGALGRPTTVDGIYSLITVNHAGASTPPYAALTMKEFDIIRCTPYFSKYYIGDGNGINIHARQNDNITSTSADSTGCITIGDRIYDNNNLQYSQFIKLLTGFDKNAIYYSGTERKCETFSNTQNNAGVLILDRTCYLKSLPTIFGDDTASGGIRGDDIATAEDIACDITASSIEWRRTIMGEDDVMVKFHDNVTTPESGITKEYFSVSYDANSGTNAPATENILSGSSYVISSVVPARFGYTFLGWDTNPNAEVATLFAGNKITISSQITLYAIWDNSSPEPHVHTWSTSLSSNETHHWYACTGCSEKNEVISHLWHSGIVIKPATKTETGIMSYTCAYCQYVKEEIIPREGLTLADVNMDGALDEDDAKTLLQHITGHDIDVNEEAIDVNGDGEVNIRDTAIILQYLKG